MKKIILLGLLVLSLILLFNACGGGGGGGGTDTGPQLSGTVRVEGSSNQRQGG